MKQVLTLSLIVACYFSVHAQKTQFPSSSLVNDSLVNIWSNCGDTNEVIIKSFDFIDFNHLYNTANQTIIVDASNINFLIDSLSTSNNSGRISISFDAKTYQITTDEPIQLKDNIMLHGQGSTQTTFLIMNQSSKDNIFEMNSCSNAALEFVHIDLTSRFGQGLQDAKSIEADVINTSVIHISQSSYCSVKGVKVSMGLGSHIMLNASNHISIVGNHFDDAWIHGSNIGGTQGYGIAFGGNANNHSDRCLIENNIIENCRHALVIQYHARNNVFGYNYTRASRAYNYVLGTALAWPTSDIVLHGNAPATNLLEGNYVEGKLSSNVLTPTNGITIDNVKNVDNDILNMVYRNYTPMLIRVQDDGSCSYNDNQLLIANDASAYDVNSQSHTIAFNQTNLLNFPLSLGLDCNGLSSNINNTQVSQDSLGKSCYLNETTNWITQGSLPFFGPDGQGAIPAFSRYSGAVTTIDCPYCTSSNSSSVNGETIMDLQLELYPNPTQDFIKVYVNTQSQVILTNLKGQLVHQGNLQEGLNEIDMNHLPSGLYNLRVTNENSMQAKRVIKF
ncbi:MAG: T9SS type A sorting domain-containing protein [Flavobacteriales bacterium]|nr:T9SS type A sorting domain-containing protein [Flavobacteriales bacterium]